jgi:hypothetical protein
MVGDFTFAGISVSQLSLYIQIFVFIGLGVGRLFAYKKQPIKHAWLMLTMIVLHFISVLFVMVPVAVVFFSGRIAFSWFTIFLALHGVIGLLVFGIGAGLFLDWGFRGISPICFLNKPRMRALIVYWAVELFYGFAIYWILYF